MAISSFRNFIVAEAKYKGKEMIEDPKMNIKRREESLVIVNGGAPKRER